MPRCKRFFISRDFGSHHIVSSVAGRAMLFGDIEKEHLLGMLEQYSQAFFVHIHSFAFMSNHLHLIVTERTEEAAAATVQELLRRYRLLRGQDADPPTGRRLSDGSIEEDEDGGIERLRRRLGSISRFMQAFKQDFSRWYNKRTGRKGYLWSDRFYDKILERGEPELVVRGYIDLNGLRAGMAKIPEDYRWCSLGLTVRNPARARRLLAPLPEDRYTLEWYRLFVYQTGGVPVPGKASIAPEIVASVEDVCGRLGITEKLGYRVRNLSEGLAFGTTKFIAEIQRQMDRKVICPRPASPFSGLFVTRTLASP